VRVDTEIPDGDADKSVLIGGGGFRTMKKRSSYTNIGELPSHTRHV